MYRDFSERSKNELLGLVSEVENDKLSNFTDWIGDRWYDFESWIGKLNIRNYLNNVNEYHKKVIDKNNTTKSSINKIFNNVKSVDTSYKETFTSKKSQLQQWQRYIDELNQIVNPRNGRFDADYMSKQLDSLIKEIDFVSEREVVDRSFKFLESLSELLQKIYKDYDGEASNKYGLTATAFSYLGGLHTFYTTDYKTTSDLVSGTLGLIQASGSAWTGLYKYLEKSLNQYQAGRLGKVWQGKVNFVSLVGSLCGFTRESIDTYKVFMDEGSQSYEKIVQVLENTNSGLNVAKASIILKWGKKELTRGVTAKYQWGLSNKNASITGKAGTILSVLGVSIDTVIGGVNKYHVVTQDDSFSMEDIADVGMASSVKGLTSIIGIATLGLSDALFDLSGKSDDIADGIKSLADPVAEYAATHPVSRWYIDNSQGLKDFANNEENNVLARIGVSAVSGIGMLAALEADMKIAPAQITASWLSSGWNYIQNCFAN